MAFESLAGSERLVTDSTGRRARQRGGRDVSRRLV